jgi:hypothetical protein
MLKKARNRFDAKTVLRSTVGHPNKATFFKSLPESHLPGIGRMINGRYI